MGEAVEKLSGKLGVDTTDFKTGIAAANRELRVLESGFKASVSSMDDWSKSSTGLENRIKSLTDKIDIQKLKVAALQEEHKRLVEANGENSRAAQEAEIKLNNETAALGKMESELSNSEQALGELSQAEDEAGNSADEASGKVTSFKDVVGGIGTVVKGALTVVAALAVAVAAVATAIGGLVFSTADASAELVDLSAKTGISTTRLQELDYIAEQVGTSQETITGSLARLVRSMSGAQTQYSDYADAQANALAEGEEFDGQLGDNAAAFDRLGVKITDANGNLRDNEAVFADLITALGKVPNEAERDALAMSLFGKSAQELNPLIKAGAEEMQRLADEAHEVGAVVDEEVTAKFEAFDDTLASLQAGLKGTLATLASNFLPGFSMVFDLLGGYLKDFRAIVDGSGGDIGKMVKGVGGLISTIISDVAAQVPQLMQTGMTILMSIVDAILQNLPMMISTGVELLLKLVDGLVTALPALVTAALQAIIALANGLTLALPTLIPTITEVIVKIVEILLANLPMLIDAALQLILALAEGLIAALPILIPAIPVIVKAIFDAIILALPMILLAAVELINALVLGLLQNVPALLTAAFQILTAFVEFAYKDGIPMFLNLGKALIEGMWQGIKNNFGQMVTNFKTLVGGMVTTIKDVLLMKSPSKVGVGIGSNLINSIGLGGEDEAPKVRKMLARQMLGLTNDLQTSISAPGVSGAGGMGVGATTISIGDIIVNVPGTSATPQQVAVAAQDGVLAALRAKGLK